MKKHLFFALAALGMLASCSNDETLSVPQEPQPQPIGFESFVNKTTKAGTDVDYLKGSGAGFNVWGGVSTESEGNQLLFEGTEVTYNISDTKWEYSPVRYWLTKADYVFTAIGPKVAKDNGWSYEHPSSVLDTDFSSKLHGTISFDQAKANGEVDLVYDYAQRLNKTKNTEIYTTVPFSFKHLLSQVKISIKNNFPEGGATLKMSQVKVTTDKKGTLNLDNTASAASITKEAVANWSWSNTDTQFLYYVGSEDDEDTSITIAAQATQSTGELYLLPNESSLGISLNAQIFSGSQAGQSNTFTATITFDDSDSSKPNKFKPGYSYNITITLGAGNFDSLNPIEFSVDKVETWTDGGSINVTF